MHVVIAFVAGVLVGGVLSYLYASKVQKAAESAISTAASDVAKKV